MFDSGARHATDAVIALARGATAAGIGRPYARPVLRRRRAPDPLPALVPRRTGPAHGDLWLQGHRQSQGRQLRADGSVEAAEWAVTAATAAQHAVAPRRGNLRRRQPGAAAPDALPGRTGSGADSSISHHANSGDTSVVTLHFTHLNYSAPQCIPQKPAGGSDIEELRAGRGVAAKLSADRCQRCGRSRRQWPIGH